MYIMHCSFAMLYSTSFHFSFRLFLRFFYSFFNLLITFLFFLSFSLLLIFFYVDPFSYVCHFCLLPTLVLSFLVSLQRLLRPFITNLLSQFFFSSNKNVKHVFFRVII